MGIRDGAALMRSSWELVRGDRALLWFPVAAPFCLLLTAGFWLFEGAWVASLHGPLLLFAAVVVLGRAGQAVLGLVLVVGVVVGVVATVVRQVFAVSLYRTSAP